MDEYFPPGYGKHSLSWRCLDSPYTAQCTFGFRNIGADTAQVCATALDGVWMASGAPSAPGLRSDQWVQGDSYTLLQWAGYQTSFVNPHNTAGSNTGASPSSANSIVVKKFTPNAGKRYRGRFAWPPFLLLETQVDAGGAIGSGALSDLQDSFTQAFDDMTILNKPMVLIHTRYPDGEQPTPTVVSGLTVQPIMGIQRRRQRR